MFGLVEYGPPLPLGGGDLPAGSGAHYSFLPCWGGNRLLRGPELPADIGHFGVELIDLVLVACQCGVKK